MTHNDLKHKDLVALLERAHTLLAGYAYAFSRPNFTDRYADGPRCKLMADRMDTALTALRSGEAVLCPREPTEEMLIALCPLAECSGGKCGEILKGNEVCGWKECAKDEYRAMLDCCAKGKP